MNDLTIGEVARRAKMRPSAIRYYEDIGVLPSPERLHGQRRYSPRVLQQLAVIQFAQQAGFTMREIQILVSGFEEDTPLGVGWRALAERKLAEVEALITKAQGMKRLLEEGMRCECLSLDECLSHF